MGELLEEHGSAKVIAAMAGTTSRSIERAKKGRCGPRLVSRLRAAREGEVFDDAREERLRLYEQRFAAGLGIFDGKPAQDAVSVYQLGVEAERDEVALAVGAVVTRRPAWAV